MIPSRIERLDLATAALLTLAILAGAAAIAYAYAALMPFVLAIFVYYIVAPLTDLLETRLHAPRWISIPLTFLLVLAIVAALGVLVVVSTSSMVANADLYKARIVELFNRTVEFCERLTGQPFNEGPILDELNKIPFVDFARRAALTALEFLATGFLVIVFVIYLLLGRQAKRAGEGIYADIDEHIRRYIATKVLTSAIVGVVVGAILMGFRLELALVFGVLTFLLNFIPSVGSVIAVLLPIPVALAQYNSLWPVAGIILLPAAVHLTVGYGLEPKMMGEGLQLHPVTVLLALLVWGLMWGPVGMLLGVPITAVLRIVAARFDATRPLAKIMAGQLPGRLAVPHG